MLYNTILTWKASFVRCPEGQFFSGREGDCRVFCQTIIPAMLRLVSGVLAGLRKGVGQFDLPNRVPQFFRIVQCPLDSFAQTGIIPGLLNQFFTLVEPLLYLFISTASNPLRRISSCHGCKSGTAGYVESRFMAANDFT